MEKKLYLGVDRKDRANWILNKMQDSIKDGKKLYYLGSAKDLEKFSRILSKILGPDNPTTITLISKDNAPADDNCAVFTDGLLYNMWYIWPMSVRNLNDYNLVWYITMSAEDFADVGGDQPIEE